MRTVGGGVTWQNRVYKDLCGPDGETRRLYQGSYPLVSLFTPISTTSSIVNMTPASMIPQCTGSRAAFR
ncbi:hypothetical protein RTE01_27470 [Raoultella terrigena]|nr:hypothetical protein RTE01_27470 [Raoultella terrigena]